MSTIALQKKRKNIDLPVETLQKLSTMAASQGESVKAFIENLLVAKATSLDVNVSEVKSNPSPSGDLWFDNSENMASVMRGIEDAKQGRVKVYTMDEIKSLLSV
jgi:type IV pilus biogenesis protein CpaD/CtpE